MVPSLMSSAVISCPSHTNLHGDCIFPGFVNTREENASPAVASVSVRPSSYFKLTAAPNIPGLSFTSTVTSTVAPGFAV